MTSIRLGAILPATFNLNADVANIRVIERRLALSGLDVDVEFIDDDFAQSADSFDLLVLGSPSSSNLEGITPFLGAFRNFVSKALAAETRVFAVSNGLHVLGTMIDSEGSSIPALDILPIRTVLGGPRTVTIGAEVRVGDDVIIGVENHNATLTVPDGDALGVVVHGVGNNTGSVEGYRTETIWGTHLHGPVLALNPGFADGIAGAVAARRGKTFHPGSALDTLNRLSFTAADHMRRKRSS